MTRIIAALLLLLVVAADLDGSALQARDNARCARWGVQFDRNGLTVHEIKRLHERGCKQSGDGWISDRYYQA